MKFGRSLHVGDARKLRELQHTLRQRKPIPFRDLPDLEFFTIGRSKEVYQKMGNSHSISCITHVDAIFTLNSRVHRCGAPLEAVRCSQ